MKILKKFFLIILCAMSFVFFLNAEDNEENIKIISLDYKELAGKGTEFTVKTEYCLPNSKLIVNVQQKKTGVEEVFEIPRISYNFETLDAIFQGIIPYNKSDIKVKFIIQNFVEKQRISGVDGIGGEDEEVYEAAVVEKIEEPAPNLISELEQRAKEETATNAAEEDYGSAINSAGIKKDGEDEPMQDPEGQNVLLITAIFPMLFKNEE